MNRYVACLALIPVVALAACQDAKPVGAKTLPALYQAHDWEREPGKQVELAFAEGAIAILKPMTRPDAIAALQQAGYQCIYGEASDDYPDPAAQCTKSFATRACQMDWDITSTAEKGKVADVSVTFRRDCVGVDDDWPDKVRSPIDDQLAPAPNPKPS
jgi:hypothetical protein